jgi:hypothetical protein
MTDTVTLDLPPAVAHRARALAAATNRRVEEVVVEWLGRIAAEPYVEELSDSNLLELSCSQMQDDEQTALSDLLGRQTELEELERSQLDGLLAIYRSGLLLKARATKEAVARGLLPRLDGHAA